MSKHKITVVLSDGPYIRDVHSIIKWRWKCECGEKGGSDTKNGALNAARTHKKLGSKR